MATSTLGSQKAVGQYPAAEILVELFNHEVRQWIAQVMFDLILECEPVLLDEPIEGCLLWLVALVEVGLRIGDGHGWKPCLANLFATLDRLYVGVG